MFKIHWAIVLVLAGASVAGAQDCPSTVTEQTEKPPPCLKMTVFPPGWQPDSDPPSTLEAVVMSFSEVEPGVVHAALETISRTPKLGEYVQKHLPSDRACHTELRSTGLQWFVTGTNQIQIKAFFVYESFQCGFKGGRLLRWFEEFPTAVIDYTFLPGQDYSTCIISGPKEPMVRTTHSDVRIEASKPSWKQWLTSLVAGALSPVGNGLVVAALTQLVQERMGDLMKALVPSPELPAFHVQSPGDAMSVAKSLQLCVEAVVVTRQNDDLITSVQQVKKNITTDEAWAMYWEFSRRKAAAEQIANPRTEFLTQRGQTLWSVAADYYGDPYYWLVLAQDNPRSARALKAGMKLRLRPFSALSAEPQLVRKGESKWVLAQSRLRTSRPGNLQPAVQIPDLDRRYVYPLQRLRGGGTQ